MKSRRQIVSGVVGGTAVFMLLFLGQAALLAGGLYSNSGQSLGGDNTYDVALGDVDGDNDLDAFAANFTNNRVWLNNGSGAFSNSGQTPGTQNSQGAALGDLDGDTDLDAFVANYGADNEVWLNNGSGTFTNLPQMMNPTANSLDVALGDVDGDNDLDAFVANDGLNEVWVNDGTAVFTLSQTLGGNDISHDVVLGDVDGDNDLDAYVANGSAGAEADELWLNNGGIFTASGQLLATSWNEGAALGDLDGDGDLDIFLATWIGADTVWLNQGGAQGGMTGEFSDSGQSLSGNGSMDVALVDLDYDNDLDAIVAKWTPNPDEIWLNDGSGNFTLATETLDTAATYAVAVGDFDGDFDDDLFFGNFGANGVWFRGGFGIPSAWFDVDARQNDAGDMVYPWAQVGPATLPIWLTFGPAGPVDVQARIEAANSVITQTIPFNAGQQTGTMTVANPQPVLSEAMTITLDAEPGTVGPSRRLHNPLHLTFVNAGAGDTICSLCFVDWLLKLLGFDTSFWMLHHLQLNDLRQSDSWNYYHALFNNNTSEVTTMMATQPTVLWTTFDALETWTPAIATADAGGGGTITVTQGMADEAVAALTSIRDHASPSLAARIQLELDVLDVTGMAGLTMDEVMARVEERIQGQVYLPIVAKAE